MKTPMLELTELTLGTKQSEIKSPAGDQSSIIESPLLINLEQIVSIAEKEMTINSTLIIGQKNFEKVRFLTLTNLRTAHIKDTLPEIAEKVRALLKLSIDTTSEVAV